ncbi:MAG: hypothetical protein KAR18_03360, partial [Spirochaetes bacterium]|nr:hypothetical protein [Spirochaetota bacterium]
MKKLIISLSTTLVIFSSLYFLIEENIIKFKSTRLTDLIRKNIETEYIEKTDILALGFQRFITITHQKLNFILEEAEINNLLQKGGDKKTASVLKDYVNSDSYCQRIRIVNQRLEIVFSTSVHDVLKSKLDEDLYGEIFQEPLSDRGSPIIDPITESIVFYKYTDEDKDRQFVVLFYYVQDALDSTFNQIEALNYTGFLITTDKIILINFPEIDMSDDKNLAGLAELISENNAGVVRILLEGHDKTIYYKNLPDASLNWTVGLTLDTERLRISKIGTLILITQALVILSVLIFVFISLRRKKEGRVLSAGPGKEAVGTDMEVPAPQLPGPGSPGEVEAAATGAVRPEPAREAPSPAGPIEPAEEAVSLEDIVDVISLKDIEEVTEVEEIGEAEVAGEIEELQEGEEALEAEEVSGLEAVEAVEEVEELQEGEEALEAEEVSGLEAVEAAE